MSWTLEARFALAAIILTLILFGIGLILKHCKITPLRNYARAQGSLLQSLAEGISTYVLDEPLAKIHRP